MHIRWTIFSQDGNVRALALEEAMKTRLYNALASISLARLRFIGHWSTGRTRSAFMGGVFGSDTRS